MTEFETRAIAALEAIAADVLAMRSDGEARLSNVVDAVAATAKQIDLQRVELQEVRAAARRAAALSEFISTAGLRPPT